MSDLVIKDKFMYSVADRDFYETMSRYQASTQDFHAGLARGLPSHWQTVRHEVWTHCHPPTINYPAQGWKIHISATPAHAPAILATVASILIQEAVSFKFLSDRFLLSLSLGKRWSRGGSGKFIAIYPNSTEQCAELLEKLHQATIGYSGPYILSDKRYRDSRVVYYRYGGLRSIRKISHDGSRPLVIADQDGNYVHDERSPFFRLPPGIVDPFALEDPSDEDSKSGTLKQGRYLTNSVLAFSNSGGVYMATDSSNGKKVVIKEARPFTNISARGLDAVQLLKKEYRVLSWLAVHDFSPKPIDFFFDWEHAFLVEEFLEGARDFRSHMGGISLALRTRPNREDARKYLAHYCEVFRQLTNILAILHRKNIVFGDLSMANVMITRAEGDTIKVRLIDFEGAHEADVDVPAHVFTPGFTSEQFSERGITTVADDIYALGSLMLSGIFPMNSVIPLDRGAIKRFLDAFSADFGFPQEICQLIEALTSEKAVRPGLETALEVLERPYDMPVPHIVNASLLSIQPPQFLHKVMAYIGMTADYTRTDRLFPADPEVFSSNPLSLAHGACGVAYVQNKVLGAVPPAVLDWIANTPVNQHAYPPGLYIGLSGIA
jgi:serine/threonine protein kinase